MSFPLEVIWGQTRLGTGCFTSNFWLRIKHEVQAFGNSCPNCQVVGPEKPRRPPLVPKPLMEELFEQMTVYITGPLEKSMAAHQSILVPVNYASPILQGNPSRVHHRPENSWGADKDVISGRTTQRDIAGLGQQVHIKGAAGVQHITHNWTMNIGITSAN